MKHIADNTSARLIRGSGTNEGDQYLIKEGEKTITLKQDAYIDGIDEQSTQWRAAAESSDADFMIVWSTFDPDDFDDDGDPSVLWQKFDIYAL